MVAGLRLPKNAPRTFGIVLYPQFEVLDVFGPIEALNQISRNLENGIGKDKKPNGEEPEEPMKCYLFAKDMCPVRSGPPKGSTGFEFNQSVMPTHCFGDKKNLPKVDVLFVPGGLGPPEDEYQEVVDFIQEYYRDNIENQPNKYLFTVCTGSLLASTEPSDKTFGNALKGIAATTNKAAWGAVKERDVKDCAEKDRAVNKRPGTWWVADARWVPQGNIWTTSGVSAGTDGMIAWIADVYGEDKAQFACNAMEYNREANPALDPFAAIYGATDASAEGVKWIIKT